MIWTSQWELMKSGPEGAQDMGVLCWWPTINDAYDTLYSLWHTEEAPFFNFAYYKNSEFDDLIDEAYATPGTEKRKELYSEAQAIIVEDAPSAYLFDVTLAIPMRSNVFGLEINPSYPRVVFYYNIYKQ
jgi:peptide/nickel transport system substrate-binding protein